MKTFLLFCVVVAAVTAEDVRLSAEQREKLLQHGVECVKETGASGDVVADAKNGNFTDNEDLKAFLFCVFKKGGILSSSGVFNMDVALQRLPAGVDKDAAEKVLKECSTKTGENASDTAYQILKCFKQNSNQRLVID